MTQPQQTVDELTDVPTGEDSGKRELSTIVFPYQDLNEGIEVAQAVYQLHGSSCELEQIAAQLKQSPTSSSFKMKISSAKIFALVTTNKGVVTLTQLGSRVCDPQQEQGARVDAFLAVPLYKAVFEQFNGTALPPMAGLEAAIGTLGVAQKQRERARQVLQRSAQQAGFFQFGTDRLVKPAIKAGATPTVTPSPDPAPDKTKKREEADDENDLHPFIKGLLKKLPPPDSEWPNDRRAKWLQAAVNIFDLMYTESEDDSRRTITIGFQKDSAK